jgi:hypothetical protein
LVPLFPALRAILWPALAILLGGAALRAQLTVATHRYDGARVGANLSELTLTAANVNVDSFGKLYSYPVDGSVYAQPLYIPGVSVGGVTRNVLYVVTMNDKVYAFDADSSSGAPLWMRDLTNPPSVTPVPIADLVAANRNIVGNVGIQGTPVIDPAARTMYFVARTKENDTYVQRLHALDITTGASRTGSPVTIAASAAGNSPDAVAGFVHFYPRMESQRAALALANGVVLIAWAGHEDVPPYHGWIMGYDSSTLAQTGTFLVTRDAYAGGVWQGGRAPTIDAAGNAYFVTGNGKWDGTRNFGNSLLKFAVSRSGLTLLDYFTPGNWAALNVADDDLSGSSFTLLPNTNLMLGGGKEGTLYLIDAANLGRMQADDSQIPQRIPETGGHVMGGPVYWNSSTLGPMIYNWSEDDYLRSYRFSGGRLSLPNYAQGTVLSPGHPGGSLTLSANGGTSGSGIVWASIPTNQDGIHGLVAGILRAFNAETLVEIWNSEQDPARDRVGTLMKFVPPLVVNGRVYMPSHDNAVAVYGLRSANPGNGARAIGIDFAGSSTTVMAATETAGVVAAGNWNTAAGAASSAPLRLADAAGAATKATVTWSAPSGTWALPITDQPGNARMMRGYLDTGSSSRTTVNVAGLPSAACDVYVYVDGDNKSTARAAAYTISGPGITTTTVNLVDAANTNFTGTFTPANGSAGNYVRFTIEATGFTLEAVPLTPETSRRAPVNGIQIVPRAPGQPPPDFTIAASPASRTVTAGSSTTYTVSVGALNGFTGTVSLAASGLPSGATAAFAPATITGSGTSTLTVTTSSSAAAGTANLTITGTSGSRQRTAAVSMTVQPPVTTTGGVISVDFVGGSTLTMAASERAGVIARTNWNSAAGSASASPQQLVDETGAATSATVAWSAPGGVWAVPIADQPGDARMMRGYLDTTNLSTTTVTFAGLPQGSYDVYVYLDGDNRGADRSAAYTISGAGVATTVNATDMAGVNFGGAFARAENSAGNYVRFSVRGTGFTIEARPTLPEAATRRAPINGIQVVPTSVPLPIGIDFAGNSGAVMAASESAGVVPQVRWNNAPGAVRTAPLALVDSSGASTTASATWTANGGWMLPIADAPGNARLMLGYLDTSSTSVTSVAVTGLRQGSYDVYVYVDGDNKSYTRSATYRISGPGQPEISIGATDPPATNFSGTFVQASGSDGNYVKFTVTGDSFTLTATAGAATAGASLRAPVNAIQIVPR